MDFVFTAFIENLRVYIFYRRLDHRKKVIVQKFERSVPKGPPTPLNPVEIHALEPVAPIPLSGPTMKRSGVNGRNERAHALKYFILLPFWKGMKEREREWEAHVRKTSDICQRGVARTKSSDRTRRANNSPFSPFRVSFLFLPKGTRFSPILVTAGKHISFIRLEAPLYVFYIPSFHVAIHEREFS